MKLDVLQSDSARPWYADGLRFTCTQCGNCCTGGPGYVWISREEIVRLAKHLGLTPQETVDRYCRKISGRFSLKETPTPHGNYDCIFLKEVPVEQQASADPQSQVPLTRRVCSIYTVRPLQCRTWPFWDSLLASEEAWNRAAARCPGINAGELHSRQHMESLRDAKDWPNLAPSSKP